MRPGGALLVAAGLALGAAGCTQIDTALASVPFFSSMKRAPSYYPYEMPRPEPAHSVPFAAPNGDYLPRFANTVPGLDSLAAYVTPPKTTYSTAELERGKGLFHRNCMPCHGPAGKGNGPIVGPGRFPFAPDLTLPITVDRTDGYLFAIMTQGRGLMPPYGERIARSDRWLVVAYLRELQKASATGGTPAVGVIQPAPGDIGWAPPARGMIGLPPSATEQYGGEFGGDAAAPTGGAGTTSPSAPDSAAASPQGSNGAPGTGVQGRS